MAKYRLVREDRTDFVLGHLHKKITLADAVAFLKERIVLDERRQLMMPGTIRDVNYFAVLRTVKVSGG